MLAAHALEVDGPDVAPEKLLRAMRLQIFFSVRPERQLVAQARHEGKRAKLQPLIGLLDSLC